MGSPRDRCVQRAVKRCVDVLASAVLLVVLSPLVACVGGLVAGTLGRPVLFVQQRPGLGGATFRLRKFRTMTDQRLPSGELAPNEQRTTRLGRILRATSLDELPELWNVLVGDMSLVGPRPLLVEYLDRYTPEQARRHEVRPGMTGLAQVSGRNALTWEKSLALDVRYVDEWSLWLDAKILARTLVAVARRSGTAHRERFPGR